MACMVPLTSILPSASRGGSSASVISGRNRPPVSRMTRTPWIGHSKWRAKRPSRHDRLGNGADVRRSVDDGRGQSVGRRGERRQLPTAEMRGKDQCRLAVVAQPLVQFDRSGSELDAAYIRTGEIVLPQPVEV